MKLRPDKQQAYWALVRSDFNVFIHQAFKTVYPGKELSGNWSIEAIIHALERSYAGDIQKLIINLPPRHLKSFLVSIAWPAFLLGRDASLKIFCVSYSDDLAKTIARDFNRVVEADWYKQVFPHVRLAKNTNGEVVTDQGGFRVALSVHGSITGRGADLIIIDDPCRPEEAVSDKARTAVNDWFRSTLLSRRDDKRHSGLILVMQRLHVNDLTGYLEEGDGVVKLALPAIAEKDEEIPLSHGRTHFRRVGEPLHAEREDIEVLQRMRAEMGPFNFESQYQQAPRTPDGSLFKRKYFVLVDELPDTRYEGEYFVSIDTALSTSNTADYTAITVVLITRGRLYVVRAERGRWEYEDLKAKALGWAQRLRRPSKPVVFLIENAGSGIPLFQFLRGANDPRIQTFSSTPRKDKLTRAAAVLPWFEARVYLLNEVAGAAWVEPFLNEFMNFPNGANDDQVDSLVQLLQWNRPRGLLPRPKISAE